jgi:O-antigen/teichoic acid export membrane protein
MHPRTYNFVRSLGAGYFAIAVNIAYTVASVPLALHYLGKEQFGLWALAQQIMGYLILLDLGVSSAVSRFIADYKDDVNGGGYGSLLLTGAIVFAIQGLIIAIVGVAFSFFAPALFAVPEHLASDFTNVLTIIITLAGFSVALRTLGAPLWAFQRMDVSYALGSLTLLTSIAALWAGFHLGWGIYSFALSGIPAAFICPAITIWFCWKSGFYPTARNWGRPRWPLFRKIFSFGYDVVCLSLGSQLVNASQIMILSRFAGLDVAATFAIGTKAFSMFQQFTGKIIDASLPILTEMFVQGDLEKLNQRFINVISITAFLATLGSAILLTGNATIIGFWTSGSILWNTSCDTLLAALLLANSFSRCLISVFGSMLGYRPVRYIYFLEGCVFIALAIPATRIFGIPGILGASLLSHLLITLHLGFKQVNKVLKFSRGIIRPLVTAAVIVGCIAFFSILFTKTPLLLIPIPINVGIVCLTIVFAWFCIFSDSLRHDLWLKVRSLVCKPKSLR